MAKKDDVYITLLKYARKETREKGQIDLDKALKYLYLEHPKVNEGAIKNFCHQALRGLPDGTFALQPGAYFQLLEHEELQEARQASHKALIVAILAVLVSSGAVITSAVASIA